MPRRTWNMIYQRARELGVTRLLCKREYILENITMDDLEVIPDRNLAIEIVKKASQRRERHEYRMYAVWLYSAGLEEVAEETMHWNTVSGSLPNQVR